MKFDDGRCLGTWIHRPLVLFLGKKRPFFNYPRSSGGRRVPQIYNRAELDGLTQWDLPGLMVTVLTTINLGQNTFFCSFEKAVNPSAALPQIWQAEVWVLSLQQRQFFAVSVVWHHADPFPWWCWIAQPWIQLRGLQSPAKQRWLCSAGRQGMAMAPGWPGR